MTLFLLFSVNVQSHVWFLAQFRKQNSNFLILLKIVFFSLVVRHSLSVLQDQIQPHRIFHHIPTKSKKLSSLQANDFPVTTFIRPPPAGALAHTHTQHTSMLLILFESIKIDRSTIYGHFNQDRFFALLHRWTGPLIAAVHPGSLLAPLHPKMARYTVFGQVAPRRTRPLPI